MCRLFDVSRSSYYAWRKQPKSDRAQANEHLLDQIKKVHKDSRGLYGSPRVTAELRAQGICCNHKRIARLMRVHGIQAKTVKKFKKTTQSGHNLPVAPNILEQDFVVDTVNTVWMSDITYIRTYQGWLYLATILDACSRQVVGWSMRGDLTEQLILESLHQAFGRRDNPEGLIFHSDRGGQYASRQVRILLKEHKITQSMCGKGNCYDNAMMESFFHTLKTELVQFDRYQTKAEARTRIFEYIEVYYNRVRRHSSLGYLSPYEYEKTLKPT
jgi:transposase InsO family protein